MMIIWSAARMQATDTPPGNMAANEDTVAVAVADPGAALALSLERARRMVDEVPPGSPLAQSLVMLVELNAKLLDELRQTRAEVAVLATEVAALRPEAPQLSPREVQQLATTCMRAIRHFFAVDEIGDDEEGAYGWSLVLRFEKDGAFATFDVAGNMGDYELTGMWRAADALVVPFLVPGLRFADEPESYPMIVTWATIDIFEREALPALLSPLNGWALERVYSNWNYTVYMPDARNCYWVRPASG